MTWLGTLTDMSPQHQIMWLNVQMQRPLLTATSLPALLPLDVSFSSVYQVDILATQPDGTNVILALNQSHVLPVHFAPGALMSDSAMLFVTQEIRYSTFRLTVRFADALGPFSSQTSGVQSLVQMVFTMNFINKLYTSFELG